MTAPGALVRALRDLYESEQRTRIRCARRAATTRDARSAECAALRALAMHASVVQEALRAFARARARRVRLQRPRMVVTDALETVRQWVPVRSTNLLRVGIESAEAFIAAAARVALVASRFGEREIASWAIAAGRARALLLERAELACPAPTLDDSSTPVSGERLVLTPMIR